MTTFPLLVQRLAIATIGIVSIQSASAVVVWSDNFDNDTIGNVPSNDFTTNGTEDWSFTVGTGAASAVSGTGSSGNGLTQTDTDIGGTVGTVATSQFSSFTLNSTTNLLKVSFDFRVDSNLSNSTNVNPRFILRQANTTGNGFVVGFSRSAVSDGDADTDNLLYVAPHGSGTSNVSPTSGAVVGLVPDTGWDTGFNFGTYDATTGSNNNTGGSFIRFELTYNFINGALTGTATNLSGGTTSFSTSINAGLTFSGGSMLFATGTNTGTSPNFVPATSVSHFDNVVVEVIPEPSSSLMLLGGLGLCFIRRRK